VSHTPAHDTACVTHLRTTPIKGFAIRESSSVFLAVDEGIAGDRAFFLVDAAGKLLSATRTAHFLRYWASFDPSSEVLAIGCGAETLLQEHVVAGKAARAHFFAERYASGQIVQGPWSQFLSEIAREPVPLVRATGPLGGFDVHPVSLLSGASVRALTDDTADEPLDSRRFRMTITVEGVPAFTEDAWLGKALRIGHSVVRMTSPIRRCARSAEGSGWRRGTPERVATHQGGARHDDHLPRSRSSPGCLRRCPTERARPGGRQRAPRRVMIH